MNLRDLVNHIASLRHMGLTLVDEDYETTEEEDADFGRSLLHIAENLTTLVPDCDLVVNNPIPENRVTRLELLNDEKKRGTREDLPPR